MSYNIGDRITIEFRTESGEQTVTGIVKDLSVSALLLETQDPGAANYRMYIHDRVVDKLGAANVVDERTYGEDAEVVH